jgi:hypothetical protein
VRSLITEPAARGCHGSGTAAKDPQMNLVTALVFLYPSLDTYVDQLSHPPKTAITFSNSDGASIASAITVSGATSETEGLQAELDYLQTRFPNSADRFGKLSTTKDRTYEEFDILTSNGKTQTVYFDVSEFIGR